MKPFPPVHPVDLAAVSELPPTGMSSVALRAAGLTMRYGSARALDGLDLEVGVGEVHAFLGPNGAGKTTTIRILLGLLRRDGGEVSLLGADPWRDAVELHQRLAYVPGDVTLWPNLTGGEIVDLLGRLRGGINASRLKALTEGFDLDTSKRARAYSRGNRQKVALLAALASDAELLLLNEPTAGLDPLMEATFRDCVNDERRNGRTILLSSHILSEAEALSDRVTIIRHGKLPGGTVSAASLLWLCPVALTISAAGLIGLRHRDLGDLGPSRPVSAVRERIVAYGSYEPSPASRGARVGRGH